jgi:hypothetical protein
MGELPLELWTNVLRFASARDLWQVRQCNRVLHSASEACLNEYLRGSRGNKPSIKLKVRQDCNKAKRFYNLLPSKIGKDFCQFKIMQDQFGFIGLSKVIEVAATNIITRPATGNFIVQDYQSLSRFLQKGWETMPASIPSALRPAYVTLFGHIVKTIETLVERPENKMNEELQMTVLAQTWRVIEVLAPSIARDLRICCNNECCDGGTDISIEVENWGSSECERKAYHVGLQNSTVSPSTPRWTWSSTTSFMKSTIYTVTVCNGVEMTLEALQHEETQMSIVDLSLNIKKWWLLANH